MKYKICKLVFSTEVHFGEEFLTDNEYCCCADTLFSAFCNEYIKIAGSEEIQKLVELFQTEKLQISDSFPYQNNKFYIPKPLVPINVQNIIKQGKKVKYLPADKINEYLEGTLNLEEIITELSNIGKKSLRVRASIHGLEETNPYWVGGVRFAKECGLYFIIGYENEAELEILQMIIKALSYTGIGGKVTSGYGKFEVSYDSLPKTWENHLDFKEDIRETDKLMTLSVSLPQNDELDKVIKNARYQLIRRGGFVASGNYGEKNQSRGSELRKQDLYVFQSGSSFMDLFHGDIYDVSNKGSHPVYRYAKPMFWRLD